MLLVDFDNVSPDVIEQAFALSLADYGAIHVRRAYCTAEQAQQHAGFLKRLSLRPMVNLAVGKNSTDIALAVDAIDLVIAERPDVVVIVSSDSDFTPLVGRLREKGCWMRGFGQQGKTGDGVQAAYDQFADLAHRDARAAKSVNAVKGTNAAGRAPPPVAAPAAPAAPAKRRPAARKKAVVVSVSPPPPPPALPPEIEAILQALPALRGGDKMQLGEAAQALRQAGLLAKTAPSTKLFKKHLQHFLLSPDRQPNKVQFTAVRP
jgi:hypothetical protein